MKLSKKSLAAGLVAAVAVIAGANHFRINTHAQDAMEGRDISALAYYSYGLSPNSIVLDVRGASLDSSAARTIGGLIDFAASLSDRQFDEVVLAWKGEARFVLDGDDFHEMGRTAAFENPVYTIRTLPEKLRHPDGSRAFSVWEGGVIGVLGAQMEDVNDFARQWYVDDVLADR